ncbi:unnamed protein product [Withania somnifera]
MFPFFYFFLIFLSFFPFTIVFSSHCTTLTSTKTFEKSWTFHPHNATLDIVFFGSFISPSGWVGFGINPNSPEMTGTRALIAFPDPNSDIHLLASSSTLYGGKMATIHNGAAIQIYTTLKLVPNKTKNVHFVWNRGIYVQGYSPTIHPTNMNDLSSVATIDVLSGSQAVCHSNFLRLKNVHGTINAISWGVILPLGAVTARYLRHVESLGPAWFYAHAGVQLSGILLGTVGFSIGIRLGQLSPGRVYGLHRKLGIAAFILGMLQTLALFFRPKTTHKFRKYWKSYHHFVGYACVVLGVVNVFQGFEVMGEGGSYTKLAYCLCLSTLIGVCVALEVNSWVVFCRKAKEEKMRREGLIGSSEKFSGSSHG